MSWQTYIDQQLLASGKISKAAIVGLQGGVWASSSGYKLSPEEQSEIIAAFRNLDNARAGGIKLAGTKYFTTNADPDVIQGRKQMDGVILAKSKQAVLVAEYQAPIQAPEANKVVLDLRDYLTSVGY